MPNKKSTLSSNLIMTKGAAAPKNETATTTNDKLVSLSSEGQPLNFKVSSEFRREFRMVAADQDMKLIDLLYASFDAYKELKAEKNK